MTPSMVRLPFVCGRMDMLKALREQNGKYLGNRPMKISKSSWKERNVDEVRGMRRAPWSSQGWLHRRKPAFEVVDRRSRSRDPELGSLSVGVSIAVVWDS